MENSKNSRSRDQIEWFESIVFALTVLVLVFTFVVRVAAVNGIPWKTPCSPVTAFCCKVWATRPNAAMWWSPMI